MLSCWAHVDLDSRLTATGQIFLVSDARGKCLILKETCCNNTLGDTKRQTKNSLPNSPETHI